jgi:hypothetical protein
MISYAKRPSHPVVVSKPGEPLVGLRVFLQLLTVRVKKVGNLLIQLLLIFPEVMLHILLMSLYELEGLIIAKFRKCVYAK